MSSEMEPLLRFLGWATAVSVGIVVIGVPSVLAGMAIWRWSRGK